MALFASIVDFPYLVQGAYIVLLAVFLVSFWDDLADEIPYGRIPLVGKNWWDLSNRQAKSRFTKAARALIAEGFSKGMHVFQIMAATRPLIVLHPKYVDEIKSHPYLDFEQSVRKVALTANDEYLDGALINGWQNFFDDRIAGFEAFHPGKASRIMVDVVRIKLNQALGSSIPPLSKEAAATVKDAIPPSDEWRLSKFSRQCPYIVARLTSSVFIGERVCHDKDWINVAVNYTVDAFLAARELRLWPSILRPLVHWFLPSMHKVRRHLAVARSIVNREIERRKLICQGKLPSDDPAHSPSDALDWFEEYAQIYNQPFDFARGQVGLALAAIHTTSNLLTNIMYDLAAYPEYIQPLRDEIQAVVAEDGVLKKTSLVKLKLMDSVMKESQRMNPVSTTSLNRVAMKQIALSDGTVLPKGATIAVSAHSNRDETIYPHAGTYNGYRFLQKRKQPGHEHQHQLVTTTNQSYYGFGHGIHACPGRFFAANESKILLIHLLLKYDWKFPEEAGRPENLEIGMECITDPTVELLFRSREPGIDLTALGE